MKKLIALLVAVMFAGYTPALYAAEALSDADMDEIAAGEWVILEEGQTVESVHYNNNDIKLQDESQKEIQGISNANAVDSAVAVQTNTASVTEGNAPTENVEVNQSNTANIANYNPSQSEGFALSHSATESFSLTEASSFEETISKESSSASSFALASSSASADASAFVLDYDLNIVETLDAAAAAAWQSETEEKGSESETQGAFAAVLDYDYNETETLDISKLHSSSDSSSNTIVKNEQESSSFSLNFSGEESKTITKSHTESKEISQSNRKDLSENNHIDLEDNSQTNLQVISNLNAVGSGVAIQNNIASNVGVSGTIIQSNTATVSNGAL